MTKPKKNPKPRVPKMAPGEAEQVRIRRELGHDFALTQDDHGRTRLMAGSEDARRVYEVSNDGYISTGGIARVRNVDPLKGILSLSPRQRAAGNRYREEFELAAREGLKTGEFEPRVDGGSSSASVPARLIDNHYAVAAARKAMNYPEIIRVIDGVCGEGMSLKELATREKVVRDIPAQLLRMGLERLAMHYSERARPRMDHVDR